MYKSIKYKCTDIDNDTNDYTASTNNVSQNNTNNTKEKNNDRNYKGFRIR